MKKQLPAHVRSAIRRANTIRSAKYSIGGKAKEGFYKPTPITLRQIGVPKEEPKQ